MAGAAEAADIPAHSLIEATDGLGVATKNGHWRLSG
jgi:hypothetical protein